MISVSSDTDGEWYIQDVRTGTIDGFYSRKHVAEDHLRWCVTTFKRWMVLKKLKPDEYEIKLDFPFWDSGNVDWYEDYFCNRGVYADS